MADKDNKNKLDISDWERINPTFSTKEAIMDSDFDNYFDDRLMDLIIAHSVGTENAFDYHKNRELFQQIKDLINKRNSNE